MRNDFGSRPYPPRFPYAKRAKKSTGGKSQGYNARLDESLGARDGKKSQSFKDRRDESKGAEKAAGKRAYSAVSTMDKA